MHLPPRHRIASLTFATLCALSLSSCVTAVYYVRPKEWVVPGGTGAVFDAFTPYLTGRRIFLDPGHGGEDRFSVGPAGDAVEADVNLRVALELRDYLLRAGATVFMSRTTDTTVSLRDRPLLAVAAGAEVFISLHHNATGGRDDITNYTSVYYHAYEENSSYHPANHDLARYIERDLAYAMRNPEPPASSTFDGTLSDFDIYPNSGFAVLRNNPLPAVLIEGSFFTHPHEEQKLALREFNRIEAWGIFVGLGKYFRAGIPGLRLQSDTLQVIPRPQVRIAAAPPADIDRTSIVASIDGTNDPVLYDDSLGMISVVLPGDLRSGPHSLSVRVRNLRGNSSWPFTKTLVVRLPVSSLALRTEPPALPPSPRATARVTCLAYDSAGTPVADGSLLRFVRPRAGSDTVIPTRQGSAWMYVHPALDSSDMTLGVSAGEVRAWTVLPVKADPLRTFFDLQVMSQRDSSQIGTATASWSDPGTPDSAIWLASAGPDGRILGYEAVPDSLLLHLGAPGYLRQTFALNSLNRICQIEARLPLLAAGELFDKTYLLDGRYGGEETGNVSGGGLRASHINLAIADRLAGLLQACGARALLVRTGDTTLAEHERARFSGRYAHGSYIRIDADGSAGKAAAEIYSNSANRSLAGSILSWLRVSAGLDSTDISAGTSPFYREVALGTVSLRIPSPSSGMYDDLPEQKIDAIAWGILAGIFNYEGFIPDPGQVYRVTSTASGLPVSGIDVSLDGTLTQKSDARGTVRFYGLVQPSSVVSVRDGRSFRIDRIQDH